MRVGDVDGLGTRLGDPPLRARDLEIAQQASEPLAVLREVDRLERRAEDRVAGRLDRARQLQRGLTAELDDDALGLLAFADGEHGGRVERLEVQAVGGVVVGRHRLRVAVDHDRLVAERAERLHGVHAAVVELDPLADAVRAGAEDDDALLVAGGRRLVALAPGRVVVVRRRLDLAGARVDAPVDGPLDLLALLLGVQLDELALEPRVQVLRVPVERALEPALRLHERLDERAADAHRLADRLHLRAERRVRAGELLEREARDLDDDVVERRLEARRRRAGQVVRDLVERVADGELRRDLRDRIAGRLRRERRRPRHARVHLDHADVARHAVARELDVRAARVDADRADDRDRRVAQLLVRLVAQRHLRRDGDRVAGVHAHRVEVLDRADDHDVVGLVAHDLELELVPAAHRLLDEHLTDRRLGDAALDLSAGAARACRRSRRRARRA